MTPAASARPLRTESQNRAIWGLFGQLCKKAGQEREAMEPLLHRLCREASGQEHTSRLTPPQAARVIAGLSAELASYQPQAAPPDSTPADAAPHEPWGERGPGPRQGQAIHPRQQQVIQELYKMLGWERPAQMTFCKRQTGQPWPQTLAHADKLIEPLSAIILRQYKPEELRARVETLVGHPKFDRWKTNFMADLARQFAEASNVNSVMTTHKLKKLLECEETARGE